MTRKMHSCWNHTHREREDSEVSFPGKPRFLLLYPTDWSGTRQKASKHAYRLHIGDAFRGGKLHLRKEESLCGKATCHIHPGNGIKLLLPILNASADCVWHLRDTWTSGIAG